MSEGLREHNAPPKVTANPASEGLDEARPAGHASCDLVGPVRDGAHSQLGSPQHERTCAAEDGLRELHTFTVPRWDRRR